MSRQQRPGSPAGQRLADILGELAIPVPFTMDALGVSLGSYLRRAVHLVPVAMGPDAPSGVFIQTAAADYLYYEQQTSPFHQMHIAVSLAARALVSDPDSPSIAPRLVPAMEPHLAVSAMNGVSSAGLDDRNADAFAVLVLVRAGVSECPTPVARRLLRRLYPLHEALSRAVPQAVRPQPRGLARTAKVRLHWQVAEVRDAMLALRPWRATRAVHAAAKAARARQIWGADFAASVEAAILDLALQTQQFGQATLVETCGFSEPPRLGPDLLSEAQWLARVSRELSRRLSGDALREAATR